LNLFHNILSGSTARLVIPFNKRGSEGRIRNSSRLTGVLLVFAAAITMCVSSVYGQGHDLVIQNGAAFSGTGTITVKDSIINSGVTSATAISGTVILPNTANQAIGSTSSGAIQFGILSLQGTGTKTAFVTVTVTDSLNVVAGAPLNISGDTLRIGKLSGNAGTITSNANSVIEYTRGDGVAQTVMSGAFSGKIRLLNNSRKVLGGVMSIDSLEHSGWGLTAGSNLTISSKASIDTLLGNSAAISTTAGSLTFAKNITNGGTITTATGTINLNGTGTQTNTGGIISITGAGALNIAGNIAANPGTLTLNSSSIVTYNGSSAGQAVADVGYSNLIMSNSTKSWTLGADRTVAGNLTLNANSATTVTGAHNLFVSGNTTVNSNLDVSAATALSFANAASAVSGLNDIVGTVTRTHAFTAAAAYTFNNVNTTVALSAPAAGSFSMKVTPGGTPTGALAAHTISRVFVPTFTNFTSGTADIQLAYLSGEIGGAAESQLKEFSNGISSATRLTGGAYSRTAAGGSFGYVKLPAIANGTFISGNQLALDDRFNVFNSIASTAYNITTTWDAAAIPTQFDDVAIINGYNVTVPDGYAASANSITINGTGTNTLTIGGGTSGTLAVGAGGITNNNTAGGLTVAAGGAVTITSGSLKNNGKITNNGSITVGP